MNIDWTLVLFVLFLLDSFSAVMMSFFGNQWWAKYAGVFAKYFPLAKGWSLLYFFGVILVGHLLGLY